MVGLSGFARGGQRAGNRHAAGAAACVAAALALVVAAAASDLMRDTGLILTGGLQLGLGIVTVVSGRPRLFTTTRAWTTLWGVVLCVYGSVWLKVIPDDPRAVAMALALAVLAGCAIELGRWREAEGWPLHRLTGLGARRPRSVA